MFKTQATRPADPEDCGSAPLAYSVTEAAQAVGLSRTTLYDLMRSGTLPSRKVAGRRLLLRRDLLDLLG
jgi:excisionase family DNA binding protein